MRNLELNLEQLREVRRALSKQLSAVYAQDNEERAAIVEAIYDQVSELEDELEAEEEEKLNS